MNDEQETFIKQGGMPLGYYLKNFYKKFEKNYGVYIISVETDGFNGFYKVGMSDQGGLSGRIANYRTMFFPVLSKVRVLAIATKHRNRRLLTREGSTGYSRQAEIHLHKQMDIWGWKSDGEWYQVPKGKLDDLVNLMIENHYGNGEVTADGGQGEVYLLGPTTIQQIDRVEVNPVHLIPNRVLQLRAPQPNRKIKLKVVLEPSVLKKRKSTSEYVKKRPRDKHGHFLKVIDLTGDD